MSLVYNHDYRHRVIEIWHITEHGSIWANSIREFRTNEGAEKYAEKLVKEGKRVLIQHGLLRWLTEDDIEKLDHTQFGPVSLIPEPEEDTSHDLPGYATDAPTEGGERG